MDDESGESMDIHVVRKNIVSILSTPLSAASVLPSDDSECNPSMRHLMTCIRSRKKVLSRTPQLNF